jgi:hypothetical protein
MAGIAFSLAPTSEPTSRPNGLHDRGPRSIGSLVEHVVGDREIRFVQMVAPNQHTRQKHVTLGSLAEQLLQWTPHAGAVVFADARRERRSGFDTSERTLRVPTV